MKKFIDLCHEITDQMPVHPFDNKVFLYQDRFFKEDNYNNFKLEIGMHSGTHIDSPMHLTNKKEFISEIPLEKFFGNGCLLDVRGENVIDLKNSYKDLIHKDDIVIIYTGFDKKYGTDEYYNNYPLLSDDLADFFIEKKIKLIGMDTPSPDIYPFKIHKKLLENSILIIENLTNLCNLTKFEKFDIIALPLKIKADSGLARVIAIER